MDSGSMYWSPDSLSVELGFRILSLAGYPDSEAQDSWIPRAKISRIKDSTSENVIT